MLRSVVEARGPVAMILAALTGTWGDAHLPSVDRRRCPQHDRGGDAARGPLARVQLLHVVVRHAVLRSVAIVIFVAIVVYPVRRAFASGRCRLIRTPKRNTRQNQGTRSN
jgi:hypothetical protein